ncbi:5-bromo-4-chloroindolyl phosphate hydrolysis family protein [Algirhabdus cladophorae]|uniref:5-bromo-4-chloroindolyl phosphate hydrolysis family protein n=1 Tax=Algirhabdus cladophorae TaxID=3377108 RepID=UPI003B84595B
MAQRYGGKYSPNGSDPEGRVEMEAVKAAVDPVGAKANVLFIPPIVVAATSLNAGALGLTLGLTAAGLMALGAWLLRDGLRAQAAYNARKVAKRPAIPRKVFAATLCGIGIALAAFRNDGNILASVLFGVIAASLHLAAFGIDPMQDKRMEGIDSFQQDRVARVVDQAEAHLQAMSDAIVPLGDRTLQARVGRFQNAALKMCRTVEEDPRDLTGARKFLGVYLQGARDATVKFADHYQRSQDAEARHQYDALLSDLEQNFAARTQKMMLDDRSDMDIEIKVLRDRLQREGLPLD